MSELGEEIIHRAMRRFADAIDADTTAQKARWIQDFKFYSGDQWGDPPPTDEECERAWEKYLADRPARLGYTL